MQHANEIGISIVKDFLNCFYKLGLWLAESFSAVIDGALMSQ